MELATDFVHELQSGQPEHLLTYDNQVLEQQRIATLLQAQKHKLAAQNLNKIKLSIPVVIHHHHHIAVSAAPAPAMDYVGGIPPSQNLTN